MAPVLAALMMLVTTFLRRALEDVLPNKTLSGLLVVIVIATAVWMDRTPMRLRGIAPAEWAMALYLTWNVYSMFAPHKYDAVDTVTGEPLSVRGFIMTAAVIPFVMYLVGRRTFDRTATVRLLLWTILALAAYSAAVSIMQFTGPTAWVWPRFIVDPSSLDGDDDTWPGRAIGVFNQPVVNGTILALGVAVALVMSSRRDEPAWRRWLALVIAGACGYGLFLTHTRAAWLSGVVALIIGALLAKGYRTGFVAALSLVVAITALNWSVFTSSDRAAGGVGSQSEVDARLNIIKTSLWAAEQKPITGWGIARFELVNTYHHQQWAPDVAWIDGFGLCSHENELGILAELGLIGLVLWVTALLFIAHRLWDAYRTLPDDDLCGKPLAVIAIIAFSALLCAGLTVDLRIFDFPTATAFLLFGTAIGWCDRHKQSLAARERDESSGGGLLTRPDR
jgi:O-antigen ligase